MPPECTIGPSCLIRGKSYEPQLSFMWGDCRAMECGSRHRETHLEVAIAFVRTACGILAWNGSFPAAESIVCDAVLGELVKRRMQDGTSRPSICGDCSCNFA